MIYFDNASTSQTSKEALAIFNEYSSFYGNPNSPHAFAFKARRLIEKAREDILKAFHLNDDYKLVFTSGSTEALNLGIIGYCLKHKNQGRRIITSKIEHPAVINCFKYLETLGFETIYLNVDENGQILLDELKKSLNKETILLSVIAVNNEIGSINDLRAIKELIKDYPKITFLSDTTQAIGKVDIDYRATDMFVISGHKINGIKGVGALIYRKNLTFLPLLYGGGQEDGLRSGTESLPLIGSLSICVTQSLKNLRSNRDYVQKINSQLRELLERRDDILINSTANCSPYIFNFSLLNKKASIVVEALSNNEIYVSSTSACQSKHEIASRTLLALNRSEKIAKNAIRVSFGVDNTFLEVETFVSTLDKILKEIRG